MARPQQKFPLALLSCATLLIVSMFYINIKQRNSISISSCTSANLLPKGTMEGPNTLLKCWHNASTSSSTNIDPTVMERGYALLITGCGYSSTGFFAKTLTAAGYPVGHERMAQFGTSSWWKASPKNHNEDKFLHTLLLVRHPLLVVDSWRGTQWPFANVPAVVGLNVWNHTWQGEYKALKWWTTFTALGHHLAECYMRSEDISIQLFEEVCKRAQFPGDCSDATTNKWALAIQKNSGYNKHKNTTAFPKPTSWYELDKNVRTVEERVILEDARRMCRIYYMDYQC